MELANRGHFWEAESKRCFKRNVSWWLASRTKRIKDQGTTSSSQSLLSRAGKKSDSIALIPALNTCEETWRMYWIWHQIHLSATTEEKPEHVSGSSLVRPSEHNLNAISVQRILKHWALFFSRSLAISHSPLVRQVTHSEQAWDCAAAPAVTVAPGSFLFSWILLVLPIMLRSLKTDKKVLALVWSINFNARKCYPCIWQHFFHNLHRNSRNYSLVLLHFTYAHSYILPCLSPSSKSFPSWYSKALSCPSDFPFCLQEKKKTSQAEFITDVSKSVWPQLSQWAGYIISLNYAQTNVKRLLNSDTWNISLSA